MSGKVGLISGGGSGHEPMHGGFVGPGMLDAACPGEVFTSPTPDQMLEATKAVDGGAGVIHIVKNYTGDVMNFDMAAEMGKGDDIEVETILTNDDVAVEDSLYTAGRRGVGVTVLVEKICGGAADDGRNLAAGGRARPPRQRPGPVDGHGADALHHARLGRAELRARRRRGRDRDRHPRRAGSLPREDRSGVADRRATDDSDPGGSAVRLGRSRAGVRQRDGRHAAAGALHRLRRGGEDRRRSTVSRSSAI